MPTMSTKHFNFSFVEYLPQISSQQSCDEIILEKIEENLIHFKYPLMEKTKKRQKS